MAPISKEELLVIMTVGVRLAPEPSSALPAAAYRDPRRKRDAGGREGGTETAKEPTAEGG